MYALTKNSRQDSKLAQAREQMVLMHKPGYVVTGKSRRSDFIAWCVQNLEVTQGTATHYWHGLVRHADDKLKAALDKYKSLPNQNRNMAAPKKVEAPKERWYVINAKGAEVKDFKGRTAAREYAKANGFKVRDRNEA